MLLLEKQLYLNKHLKLCLSLSYILRIFESVWMSGQTIALSLFLVLLAIGSIILIGSVIVIKRTVALRKSRIGRIIYTPIGNGAPKVSGNVCTTYLFSSGKN